MARVSVATTVSAPPAAVWAHIADVRSHGAWMKDAEAIRLVGGRANQVGATYEVDTRVGPLRLLDVMEVTEYDEARVMGVRHVGLVTGTGRFTLRPTAGGTHFEWNEDLVFPWWMGGFLGAAAGSLVLKQIWRKNLRRLKQQIEQPA